jgi:predicted lipoprotein with Yx(FWY)xxD motif
MRRPLAILTTLALTAGVAGGTATVALSKGSSATIKTRSTSLGTVLVDAKGRTAYLFEKDKKGKSSCSGQCAVNWPPVLTSGKPKAGGGAAASRLGTTRRADGTTQVTYAGHPLYRFVADKNQPGSTKGEGIDAFGAEWYVVGTNGKKIEKEGDSSSAGGAGNGGY